MKLLEARSILSPPLVFGDDRQIRAHEFLVAVEDALEHVRACPRDHRVHKGQINRRICVCDCVDGFDVDVALAAAQKFAEEVES